MAIIYVLQNHFSAAFIIGSVTLIQMLVAGVRLTHLVILAVMALPFLGIVINSKSNSENGSFRMTRIQTWLNPWNDITGERMANSSKFICYRIRRIIWSRASVKVNKNTYIYQSLKTISYLRF